MQSRIQSLSRVLRARGLRADQPGAQLHSHHSADFQARAYLSTLPGVMR